MCVACQYHFPSGSVPVSDTKEQVSKTDPLRQAQQTQLNTQEILDLFVGLGLPAASSEVLKLVSFLCFFNFSRLVSRFCLFIAFLLINAMYIYPQFRA